MWISTILAIFFLMELLVAPVAGVSVDRRSSWQRRGLTVLTHRNDAAEVAGSSSPSIGRFFVDVRGGASKEWVCDGDVCELKDKPGTAQRKTKSSSGGSSSRNTKKSRKGKSKSPQLTKPLKLSSEGSILSKLTAMLFGKGEKRGLTGILQSFFAKVFGGGADASEKVESRKRKKAKGSEKEKEKNVNPKAIEASIPKKKAEAKAKAKAARRGARRKGGAGASRTSAALRIQRELRDFQTNPPPNCAVAVRPENLNVWVVTLTGVEGTLFAGEKYKLRVEFPKE